MEYRLLVSDVDGTLIPDDTPFLSVPGSERFLKLLRERNLPLAVASGRAWSGVEKVFRGVPLEYPTITGNGIALIENGMAIWQDTFPASYLRKAVRKARDIGISIIFNDGLEDTVEELYGWAKTRTEKNGHPYLVMGEKDSEFWRSGQIGKVLFADEEKRGRVEELKKLIPPEAPLEVLQYGTHFLDVMPKGSSKGKALLKLLEILGIDRKAVIAIGDEINDLEMVKLVGAGCAVGNASAELKTVADYTATEDSLKGVIEIIEHYT